MSALTKELKSSSQKLPGSRAPERPDRRSRPQSVPKPGAEQAQSRPQAPQTPADPKLLSSLLALTGQKVSCKVRDGTVYEGILYTASAEGKEVDIALLLATVVQDGAEASTPVIQRLKILPSDIVHISAKRAKPASRDAAGEGAGGEAFGTDAEIGAKAKARSGRELQRWAPEAGIADPLQSDGMDLHLGSKGATWDQFAANEQQFGVRTTYDEDLYTTKLDKGRAKMSAAEADRIAAEIEGQGPPASRHLPDERGAAAALDEMDEEALYSSVQRPSTSNGASSWPASSQARGGPDGMQDHLRSAQAHQNGADGRSSSQPINMASQPSESRRHVNKVRMTLGVRDPSSPYGTPKAMSGSPAIGSLSQMQALDLQPASAKFDKAVRKEFAQFKAEVQKTRGHGSGDPSNTTSPDNGPSAASNAVPRREQSGAAPSTSSGRPGEPSSQPSEPPGTSQPAPDRTPLPAPLTSKLNPKATEFKFNPKAADFRMSSPSTSTAAAPSPLAAPHSSAFGRSGSVASSSGAAPSPTMREQSRPSSGLPGQQGRPPMGLNRSFSQASDISSQGPRSSARKGPGGPRGPNRGMGMHGSDMGGDMPSEGGQPMMSPQGMQMIPPHMAQAYMSPPGMYLGQPGFMPGMMMPRPFNGGMLVPQGMQGMAPHLVPMYPMHQGMQRPPMYASQPFGPMGQPMGMPMASGPLGPQMQGPPMQGGHPNMSRRPM